MAIIVESLDSMYIKEWQASCNVHRGLLLVGQEAGSAPQHNDGTCEHISNQILSEAHLQQPSRIAKIRVRFAYLVIIIILHHMKGAKIKHTNTLSATRQHAASLHSYGTIFAEGHLPYELNMCIASRQKLRSM